jgi:hypothetical protein
MGQVFCRETKVGLTAKYVFLTANNKTDGKLCGSQKKEFAESGSQRALFV